MLIPGTVKAGDELIYEFGNRVKQRKIVKVQEVLPDGTIILDTAVRCEPDGTPTGLSSYHAELHPLITE